MVSFEQPGHLFFGGENMSKILLILVLLFPLHALSWGTIGHRAVGIIAESQLKPETKIALKRLLAFYTLGDVASWADSIRDEGTYEQTTYYHFEKVPDSKSYIETLKTMRPHEQKQGGVVTAILYANKVLRTPSATLSEQAAALRFLVHFVGDIHQPLHSGRPGDKGGLNIRVNWFGENASLHQIWDSKIIEAGRSSVLTGLFTKDRAESYAKYLLSRPMPPVVDTTMNVEAWLNEAIALRPAIYDAQALKDPKSYTEKHIVEVDHAIYSAGVRLAAMLNDIFSHSLVETPSSQAQLMGDIEAVWGSTFEQTMSFAP